MVEKRYKQIETIEYQKNNKRDIILNRQTSAKTFKSWLENTITLLRQDKNLIEEQLLKAVLQKYLEYNKPVKEELKDEYGKSSFEYKELPEIIEVTTYQKGKAVVKNLSRKESEWIIGFLNKFKDINQWNSINLGLIFSKYFSYKPLTKEQYYSDRFFQNYWTTHLRYLREIGLIEYDAGVIKLK
jgi:hypothetical protein